MFIQEILTGTSLIVQGLTLCSCNAENAGSIPGWGIKIPHATWPKNRKKKKYIYCVLGTIVLDPENTSMNQIDESSFPLVSVTLWLGREAGSEHAHVCMVMPGDL